MKEDTWYRDIGGNWHYHTADCKCQSVRIEVTNTTKTDKHNLPDDYIDGVGQPADAEAMLGTSTDKLVRPDKQTEV